ncbi:MAG: T9SS type A sorting domain-containing protein [Bacteroidota bacterium]
MKKIKGYFLLALSACILKVTIVNAQLTSGNVFLLGSYSEFGIAPNGAFGSNVTPPAGSHPRPTGQLGFVSDPDKDGWTVGSPAYIGDYFIPGTPQEGWAMSVNGSDYQAYRGLGGTSMTGGLTGSNVSYVDSTYIKKTVWQGSISAKNLVITQTTTHKPGDIYVKVNVVIKNTGATTQPNVYYTRTVDPDNEASMPGGSYTTDNKILTQIPHPSNHVLVTATGTTYGSLLALGTKDPRAKAYILDAGLYPTASLSAIYNGTGAASAYAYDTGTIYTDDVAIGIVYKLDSVEAGDSLTINYGYMLEPAAVTEAFADFTDPIELPLSFLSFNTRKDNCTVVVNWEYNTDEKIDNFTIERSTDGIRYNPVAVIKSNVNSYVDVNPAPGNSFYRVKAKTLLQRNYYSGTSVVKGYECEGTRFTIKPNPVKDFIEINAPVKFESGSYAITSNSGQKVSSGILVPNTKNTIDIKTLNSGEYILSLFINNTVYSSTFTVN